MWVSSPTFKAMITLSASIQVALGGIYDSRFWMVKWWTITNPKFHQLWTEGSQNLSVIIPHIVHRQPSNLRTHWSILQPCHTGKCYPVLLVWNRKQQNHQDTQNCFKKIQSYREKNCCKEGLCMFLLLAHLWWSSYCMISTHTAVCLFAHASLNQHYTYCWVCM